METTPDNFSLDADPGRDVHNAAGDEKDRLTFIEMPKEKRVPTQNNSLRKYGRDVSNVRGEIRTAHVRQGGGAAQGSGRGRWFKQTRTRGGSMMFVLRC